MSLAEDPAGARRSQEDPGAARRTQEELGTQELLPWRSHSFAKLVALYTGFKLALAQLILRWFQAVPEGPGASKDKEKEAQEDLRKARGDPPRSLETLFGFLCLILAFPWAPMELI